MKKLLSIIAFIAAGNALAATCWMDTNKRNVLWIGRPDKIEVGNVIYVGPSDDLLAAAGWVQMSYEDCVPEDRVWGWEPEAWARKMTQEEMEARDAEQAAEQAEADAQASLPLMNGAGFASTNAAGHWVKFIPSGTNEVTDALAVQISHSPPDPVVAAQMEAAAIAKYNANMNVAREAKKKGNGLAALAERVSALEAFSGIE